jgi:hypothetical protein
MIRDECFARKGTEYFTSPTFHFVVPDPFWALCEITPDEGARPLISSHIVTADMALHDTAHHQHKYEPGGLDGDPPPPLYLLAATYRCPNTP